MTNTAETIEILDLTPVRESVALEIKELMDNIGDSYVRIGRLLCEAREDFDKQADFLEWCNTEFGIKKAQCYNLMKIAKTFDGDKRFSGVAMRVMLSLTEHAEDESLITKAAELAASGDLTTSSLQTLVSPVKPVKPASGPEIAAPAANDVQPLQSLPEDPEIGIPDDVVMPWDDDEPTLEERELTVAPTPATPVAAEPVKNEESERITALLSLIEQLKTSNERMAEELTSLRSSREAKKASAPMLPHFKHKCMAVRLGLTDEEASVKAKVNKAKRELVKAGYGEGHEAWPFISEAVETLTQA